MCHLFLITNLLQEYFLQRAKIIKNSIKLKLTLKFISEIKVNWIWAQQACKIIIKIKIYNNKIIILLIAIIITTM